MTPSRLKDYDLLKGDASMGTQSVLEYYGENVFNLNAMKEYLLKRHTSLYQRP